MCQWSAVADCAASRWKNCRVTSTRCSSSHLENNLQLTALFPWRLIALIQYEAGQHRDASHGFLRLAFLQGGLLAFRHLSLQELSSPVHLYNCKNLLHVQRRRASAGFALSDLPAGFALAITTKPVAAGENDNAVPGKICSRNRRWRHVRSRKQARAAGIVWKRLTAPYKSGRCGIRNPRHTFGSSAGRFERRCNALPRIGRHGDARLRRRVNLSGLSVLLI